MSKVALIIIYNHKYTQNIDPINKIYSKRFSNIYHLMPFYEGTEKNVISVYENSYYHQGYISQGLSRFYNENYDDYIFIADDLLLKPDINENNYTEFFQLTENACFLPEINNLHEIKFRWTRLLEAVQYNPLQPGLEISNYLPSVEDALKQFSKFELTSKPIESKYITEKDSKDNLYFSLRYPLVGGNCDMFIVNKDCIKKFSYICSIFAVTSLFVELAVPTAIALVAKNITLEKNLKYRGPLYLKSPLVMPSFYGRSLSTFLNNFPDNHLYVHPVKLSKWNIDI